MKLKKCAVLMFGVLLFSLMGGCGSDVKKLNKSETSIFNAFVQSVTSFYNPQSVKILECSDITYTTDLQKPYFVTSDNAHCYMRVTAENGSGGTSNVVYCLLIDSTDNYEAGTMWTWDDVMNNLDSMGMDSKMMDVFLKDYTEISDYYVPSSSVVDVSKLNNALDEYMQEKGYK